MSVFSIFPRSWTLVAGIVAGGIAAGMIFSGPRGPVVLRDPSLGAAPEKMPAAEVKLPRNEMPAPAPSGERMDEAGMSQKRIADLLATGKFEDRQKALTHELRELIEMNPTAASVLAEAQKPGAVRDEMVARVARIWAEADPERSWQWATRLADADERRRAQGEVALQMVDEQPGLAVEMAMTAGLNQVLGPMAQRWAAIDLAGARAWVAAQPASAARGLLTQGLAMALVETAPDQAARLVSAELPPGPVQEEAAMTVLHCWARQNPAEARRWVEAFPSGTLRNRALRELDAVSPEEAAFP